MVFSRGINKEYDILEIKKERKRDKSLRLKEFVSTRLYFERHTNRVSNLEMHANLGLNIEIWCQRTPLAVPR
jgi:hypothetical protein